MERESSHSLFLLVLNNAHSMVRCHYFFKFLTSIYDQQEQY